MAPVGPVVRTGARAVTPNPTQNRVSTAAPPPPRPATVGATGAPRTATSPQPAAPRPARLSVSAGVSKVQSATSKARADVVLGDTNDLGQQFFRDMVYGPTGSRKTVLAATFGTTEEVRIILTRRKEQLRPLEDLGYKYALVQNSDALESVLTHPEIYWTDPTWVKNPNRTLVVDDLTEGIALLVDDNSIINDKVVKDRRRSYMSAGTTLRDWIKLSFNAPQHIILTALEKVKETVVGERIDPDLPPSMRGMITTDLEYVFYIKTGLWKLLMDRKRETFSKKNDEGKTEEFTRDIYAKNKQKFVPGLPQQKSIFGIDEPMDLRAIWKKIASAKAQAVAANVGR